MLVTHVVGGEVGGRGDGLGWCVVFCCVMLCLDHLMGVDNRRRREVMPRAMLKC